MNVEFVCTFPLPLLKCMSSVQWVILLQRLQGFTPRMQCCSSQADLRVYNCMGRRARKRPSLYFSSDSYEIFAAPLLLWLPEDRIKASAAEVCRPEDLVDPQGPLSAAVETALRWDMPPSSELPRSTSPCHL